MNNISILPPSPKEIGRAIAANIRALRRRRRISQERLADLSGVSLGSVKRFETSGEISLLSLGKIALALGIEKELSGLFSDIPPESIDEVIREGNQRNHRPLPRQDSRKARGAREVQDSIPV